MIRIITTNAGVISQVSKPVDNLDIAKTTIMDMIDTANEARTKPIGCVGLAAIQIGIAQRIIIIHFGGAWLPMINPKITKSSKGNCAAKEGCLSRPRVNTSVRRSKRVVVDFINEAGIAETRVFTKHNARIVQHEIDHIDGRYI